MFVCFYSDYIHQCFLFLQFSVSTKVIVYPKMKMLSSFTTNYVFSNLYDCIILKNAVTKQFWFPLTFIMDKQCNGNQWQPKLFAYRHSSKYFLLCSGLKLHEGDCHFWVGCLFKSGASCTHYFWGDTRVCVVVMEILILSRDSFTFSSFTKMIRSDSFTDSFSDHFFILHKYASRWRKRVYYVLCLNERTVFTCYKKMIWLY